MRRALLVAAIAAACNRGGAPTASAPAPAVAARAAGSVVKTRFTSEALGVRKQVAVYLPAGYATSGKRYPVFYYLHGLGGDELDWLEGGQLAATADALGLEAIVVMPDGDDGWYVDAAKPVDYDACLARGDGLLFPQRPRRTTCVRASHYATYITRDLIGWVDRTYRTIASRDGRAIAGLSMGGFGALQLAMRNPTLFAAAASHSGFVALLYGGPVPYAAERAELVTDLAAWGDGRGPFATWMRGLLGTDLANWRAHDPATLVETLAPGTLALYVDCGTDDMFELQHRAAYLHDRLRARGLAHAFALVPGKHDFTFWRARLPLSLAFLREHTAAPR